MNKHLIDFFDDEIKTNDYYEPLRQFAQEKNIDMKYIVSDVVNEYEDHYDAFGPYKFVDAIADYLTQNKDEDVYENATELQDIINAMWDEDFFENY